MRGKKASLCDNKIKELLILHLYLYIKWDANNSPLYNTIESETLYEIKGEMKI